MNLERVGTVDVKTANLTGRTRFAIRDVLDGRRSGLGAVLPFVGPAVIASIAYMDPGNFATNIQAGAGFGYELLWVVVVANAIALLFQSLSAKLGIVTGRNLAELCRDHFPPKIVWAMWGVSEVAAMATDLAEFVGAAIGLSLLLHLPMLAGMTIVGVVTYAVLSLERGGFRPLELCIAALVVLIGVCYLLEVLIAPVDWRAAGLDIVVPHLGPGALAIAVGIVGATVMPHAIYLHSGLTQARVVVRNDSDRRKLLRFSNWEVAIALTIAGLVNLAMVIMAASAFHAGHSDVAEIETAYKTLAPLLGHAAAAIFLVSLIASGLSSSVVGTMAGQMIMQGFTGFSVPVSVRRLVTMVPAFLVVAAGVNVTNALVVSQIVLSLALPVPMIALVILLRRPDVMGAFASGRAASALAIAATAVVMLLNGVLLMQVAGLGLPFAAAG